MTGTTWIAKRTTTAVSEKPIPDVVAEIRGHMHDADIAQSRCIKSRLVAGQKLLGLRKRIEAGELGKVDWWPWCEVNIQRSRKDCERLMRIAGADNPEAALEAEQAKDRDRKRIARSLERRVRSRRVEAGCQSGTFVTILTTKAEKPDKRHPLTDAEKERDELLGRFWGGVRAIGMTSFSDPALELLTEDEMAYTIEAVEQGLISLRTLLDQLLRLKGRETA